MLRPRVRSLSVAAWIGAALLVLPSPAPAQVTAPERKLAAGDEYLLPSGAATCERTIKAHVVAIDQVLTFNRLGAFLPSGMVYALARDVVARDGARPLGPGNATLRPDKRPRPIVLRMNEGDCLEVTFTNWLATNRADNEQPLTRAASLVVDGLSLVGSIASGGLNLGQNASALAAPGQTRVYRWYGSKEGVHHLHSGGALTGGEGNGGQVDHGLFGAVLVEPRGSTWLRSQVTAEELALATYAIDASGNRLIDYDARYPANHADPARRNKPVLKMLDAELQLFHSDLNAVVTDIAPGSTPYVAAAAPGRARNEPFREFTVIYHDENALVQAFPVLSQAFFAHSVRDNMAINYGTAGAGAEIISYGADEIQGVTPHVPAGNAARCNDCKYEEAFLSSWTVGDPAMVFERADPTPGAPLATGTALEALYPDDPSNVHHSYLNDHVRMRVLNGGVAEHHLHHLHAHQWLQEPDSDNSTYFDSQAIGPGSGYTLDITYNGSGNRNKTPGDAIFHCHFYPHFAQGMWELWRVHDVFEDGTRTLPDAELALGTPVPGIVPLPEQAMAPPPSAAMPGYPFYIPGVAGHRPPHPPLDTLHDGGLPRHVVLGGTVLDGVRGPFDRTHVSMEARAVPEEGTQEEQAAMDFHALRVHASKTPEGYAADFVTNGRPPVAGAPFADPCVDDVGNATGTPRTIKAAVFQTDAIFNKAGWHFPQWRMLAHWEDVDDYQSGARAPEPFFMRARSGDCITYQHTNLVPHAYEADDFQIYTPTDIIGQHIHLVKFDVMASDGSGNGWNYEDGTFAPGEVIERIEAINAAGGLLTAAGGGRVPLHPAPHPFFGVLGAQTTIQRWWADPLLNAQGKDRTIRTVYTHDHFGPSTHQQAGLYASLLIEPAGSSWRHPESGAALGTRHDGGPTSWRADILTANAQESYREFMFMHQDFHLAYTENNVAVNPPGRVEAALPFLFARPPVASPEAVSADDVGTYSVNYRNEPLALRLRDPATNAQATGAAGDAGHAYRSVGRRDADFNTQPLVYPPLTADVRALDPYTPILRAYEGDKVQVRFIVGATEEGHNWTMHGLRWLHEADDPTSRYKNSEMHGISEHFELDLGRLPAISASSADYVYQPGASVEDQWNGSWGLLREYKGLRPDLLALPSNSDGRLNRANFAAVLGSDGVAPRTAPVRTFDISAVRAADALPGGKLVYNTGHSLNDPTALLYVNTADLDTNGRLRSGVPIEPLVLRANAGDHLVVTLRNKFKANPTDAVGFNAFPPIVDRFQANHVRPSPEVGLHPQLVHYDVLKSNGVNAGLNALSTVKAGQSIVYHWYAGTLDVNDQTGVITATPVEFGATNLMPADPLKHSNKGLVGALIIEPKGSSWTFPNANTRAMADVTYPGGTFREFTLVLQDDVNLRRADGSPVPPVNSGTVAAPAVEDSEDSGNRAFNYRTEPMWTRLNYEPGAFLHVTKDLDLSGALSIAATGFAEVPPFRAPAGTPIRFRVVQPGGHGRNAVFALQGHVWRHEPGNPRGGFVGAQAGLGPSDHWDFIPLHGAGGAFGVTGDYLYRNKASFGFDGGQWGLFRVDPR
ncbi:MAG: copper oxidase [Planctomycetes bacterium]|nr:copper oxidase [Planctomycetota bacterium]